VAKTERGRDLLLVSGLEQVLWLPLSEVRLQNQPKATKGLWVDVFRLSLTLASILQQSGGQLALECSSLDAAILLKEQLTTALSLPRALAGKEEANLMVFFCQLHSI